MNKRGNKRGNKKGQFYLIAAIIIITIAAGFITISNYASSQQTQDIYYLKDEIKIESSRAMDYAILNNKDFSETMANFSQQYINNTFGNNFYFIFGDEVSMTFLAEQSFDADITLDTVEKTVGTGEIYKETFVPGENVTLGINGNDYVFKLNIGNNYGFVISSEKGGQTYTVKG